ncbi:MAG: hypothetical protein QXG40_00325 [Ignisphaera sp.]
MCIVDIKFFVFGNIPRRFIDRVIEISQEFLQRVGCIDYIELYFYSSSREKLMFLESEAVDLGVIAVGDFIVMHEAWRGWPRIHVDFERCSILEEHHLKAIIVHEMCHAVLHGSPLYYIVSFNPAEFPALDPSDAARIIYIASTIVKDFDVYNLLTDMDMYDAIYGYIDFILKNQYDSSLCLGIENIFQLAKILLPCIFVENCPLTNEINRDCIDVANRLLAILSRFKSRRVGDLSTDTISIAKQILEVALQISKISQQ